MMRRRPALAALLALGFLVSEEVKATSLEITPVAVHLVPGQNATTIEVMNRGGVAAAIQLRAYAWAQAGDKDLLTPTQDILLSPPIFTVAKGATQTIRLLLRGSQLRGSPDPGERTYRLLLDEVPATHAGEQQVRIAMRVSMPVMIASPAPKGRSLIWRAQHGVGNQIVVSVTNVGKSFDRVQAIEVTLANGSHPKIAPRGKNSYILAGTTRQWIVQASGGAVRQLRLSLTTQAGKSERVLVLDP